MSATSLTITGFQLSGLLNIFSFFLPIIIFGVILLCTHQRTRKAEIESLVGLRSVEGVRRKYILAFKPGILMVGLCPDSFNSSILIGPGCMK